MNVFIRYTFLLFFLVISNCFFSQSTIIKPGKGEISSEIDSLLLVLKTTKADTNQAKLLNDIGQKLIAKSEYQLAINYSLRLKVLASKLNYKIGVARAYNCIGNANWYLGDREKALQNWLASLKVWEEIGNKKGMASVNSNIAMIYSMQGAFEKALKIYENSLHIGESINNKGTMAESYNGIGDIYVKEGQVATVKEIKRSKYELALESRKKALRLEEEIGDKKRIAQGYINIGNNYYYLGNVANTKKEAADWYEKDLEYQFKALKVKEEMEDKYGMEICYMSIGTAYDMKGEREKSRYYLEKALVLSKEIGAKADMLTVYNNLTIAEEEIGDYKKALEYHKLFTDINDSLRSEKSTNQIIEMQAKYESEKKQKENEVLAQKNELLDQENNIQDLKIKQSRYFIFGLLLLSLLIIGIAFLLIRQNKTNALHAKIEMEQKLLRSQMNPHFIFNAMVGIQNYIYKEEPEVAANYLSSVVQLMRSIIDNSKKEYVILEKEIATLNHYLTLQKVRFQDKFNFKIETEPGIDLESTLIPPMIAQPFIENAIVHGIMHKANGQGLITVRFSLKMDNLYMEIEDNGIGREKAKLQSNKESTHLSIATDITQERLTILNRKTKNRNSMIITDLRNESGQSTGTKVTFIFPYINGIAREVHSV